MADWIAGDKRFDLLVARQRPVVWIHLNPSNRDGHSLPPGTFEGEFDCGSSVGVVLKGNLNRM
jgi:hypothetical protein